MTAKKNPSDWAERADRLLAMLDHTRVWTDEQRLTAQVALMDEHTIGEMRGYADRDRDQKREYSACCAWAERFRKERDRRIDNGCPQPEDIILL